ncbi:MAG TPA: DNA-binding response regulator [Bacteroidales bacterium]|nr:DNA-binding response regulator [Bacteroidales bacterium]
MLEVSGLANIIGEVNDGDELLPLLEKQLPDLILMDIDMPRMNGIIATKKALNRYPGLKILALSMFGEHKYYYQMIEAGAHGFLLKSANKAELEKAISEVINGQNYFSQELLEEMVNHLYTPREKKDKKTSVSLSAKELEIVKYLAQGFSNDEIAEKIFLSAKTIANYRNNMLQKTGCKNSTNLVFYAIKNNLIQM